MIIGNKNYVGIINKSVGAQEGIINCKVMSQISFTVKQITGWMDQ